MEGAFVDVSRDISATRSLPTYRRARTDRVVIVRCFQKHACVQNAIVGKDCKIGQWGRVDGEPASMDSDSNKLDISILGKS
jgi:hypothetical protein